MIIFVSFGALPTFVSGGACVVGLALTDLLSDIGIYLIHASHRS